MKSKAKKTTTTRKAKVVMPSVKPETFVEVWQTSTTPLEVAKATGLTKETAVRKAIAYRKNGVPLKKMSRGRSKADWTPLIELATRLSKAA